MRLVCSPPAARSTAPDGGAALDLSLGAMDAGSILKLTPMSYRGPRGCPIVSLSRRRSKLTSVITSMRQGEASMERFPCVAPEGSVSKSKVAAVAEPHHSRS